MTWNNHYRRAEVLREVIRIADERRDGQLPMDVPGVAETFNDELTVVLHAQVVLAAPELDHADLVALAMLLDRRADRSPAQQRRPDLDQDVQIGRAHV